jgi:Mg2+/Co2+ transporter CorB
MTAPPVDAAFPGTTLAITALFIVCLLALSALFSAAETALTGVSRARMHQLERDGDSAAKRVNWLLERQGLMIGSVLLGNNLVNILSSAIITETLGRQVPGGWGVALSTVITTVLVLVFAEVLPKTIAITRLDDMARRLAAPTSFIVKLFGPIITVVQWFVGRILRLFGIAAAIAPDAQVAQEEIRGAVEYHHAEGLVEARARRMLGGVLDLADMDVTEVMVHRRKVQMLDADLPPRRLVEAALASHHTRLPLYRGEPDNIVAMLHGKDLARAVVAANGDLDGLDIASVAKKPWFIPDSTSLKDQLDAFLKTRNHVALIVDEYGALQGLLTLEDILEEIVGEIEDEHDTQIEGVRRQPDGSVNVDGAVTIRDLNRAMDWNLPDDEWVTVAGLVLHEAQTIPEPGQTFIFHNHRFQVLRRQRNQITALRVSAPLQESA